MSMSPPGSSSGNLLTQAIGGIGGFLTGGVPGAIAGWAAGGSGGGPGTSITTAQPSSPFQTGGFTIPFPVSGPGGVPLPGFAAPQQGQAPKGYHLNKHALAPTKHHGAVAAHSMWVRNRHMHPLNSKAIVHSLRRIKRARKIVAKLHSFGPVRRLASGGRGGHKAGCRCVTCRR
jgi:hypothetical protein